MNFAPKLGRYRLLSVFRSFLWTAKNLRRLHSLVRMARFSQLLCLTLPPKGKHLLFKSQLTSSLHFKYASLKGGGICIYLFPYAKCHELGAQLTRTSLMVY